MQPILEQLQAFDDQRFLELYTSLVQRGFGPLDGEVARAMKFRPHAIVKLPLPQRAKKARQLLLQGRNSELAYELFGSYLLSKSKDLVTDFLDATGVSHEDGLVEDTEENLPDAERVEAAVTTLDAKYPPEDVTLYLCLSSQTWPEIAEFERLWRARSGLGAS
jgi:hypothetical protein